MITPKLEQLIWEGKAFFKTFVTGPHKSTLNIDNDRFIIITDINFLGYFNSRAINQINNNVQLSIYGEKGFNHYIFRGQKYSQSTFFNLIDNIPETNLNFQSCDPQTINTYLIHSTQVGFSFIIGSALTYTNAIAADTNPSFTPPLDYGKLGDVGAVPIAVQGQIGTMNNFYTNRAAFALPDNTLASQQFQYAASAATLPEILNNGNLPICNINYIEILGQPENMQF